MLICVHAQLRQRVEEKNTLLRQLAGPGAALAGGVGGAGLVDLSAVTQRWDGFTAALHQVRAHEIASLMPVSLQAYALVRLKADHRPSGGWHVDGGAACASPRAPHQLGRRHPAHPGAHALRCVLSGGVG